MADRNPSDFRHAVVDCIYSSAVEPGRFESLIDSWDKQLKDAGFSNESLALFDHDSILEHTERADELARAIAIPTRVPVAERVLTRIKTAAFVCTKSLSIAAANKSAESLFNISSGMNLKQLQLSSEGLEHFETAVRQAATAGEARQEILRLKPSSSAGLIFAFISPLMQDDGDQLALVVTTEHVWHEQAEKAFKKAFGFTTAEISVLRSILSGASVAELAEATGRSESTIRSQIHSLLNKTGARSQAELLSLTLAFQEAIELRGDMPGKKQPSAHSINPLETLILPDGRRLDFMRLGDPQGRPCVWLHSDFPHFRLRKSAEDWLQAKRICLVVPIRAGYGFSSPKPKKLSVFETAAADFTVLRQHLGIGNCLVISHGSDFLLACTLASQSPGFVTGIIAVASHIPLETPEDYESLSRWARLFRANARHAPKVLSFLARAGLSLVRTIGFENFIDMAGRGTVDGLSFREPETRAAMIAGSEVTIRSDVDPVNAFVDDIVGSHAKEWPDFSALKIPVTLFHGEQDTSCGIEAVKRFCVRHPNWKLVSFPGAGNFVQHQHWRELLELIDGSLI